MTSPDHSTPSPARPIPKPDPDRAIAIEIQPVSPRYPLTPSSSSPSSGASSALFATAHGGAAATAPHRKIGIPVDLSNESAFAVRWAVQNYLRPGDDVTLIHVRPTSILYGADWGSTPHSSAASSAAAGESNPEEEGEEEVKTRNMKKMEDEFDRVTAGKISELAEPLAEAKIPYRVHTVKDHDMKERLCLEIERLGMSVVIMGSRGFGASAAAARRSSGGRLGSVSDYCVHHCICPVVVVRFPEDREADAGVRDEGCLDPVPEEETAAVSDAPPRDHLHKGSLNSNDTQTYDQLD